MSRKDRGRPSDSPTTDRERRLAVAAMEALMAIADYGLMKRGEAGDGRAMGYIMIREEQTGKTIYERIEAAHDQLRDALQPYRDVLFEK
jgi:hypothetical protein